MAETDVKVYEFTNSMFDKLEERGIEVDGPIATFVRACARQAVDLEGSWITWPEVSDDVDES